MISTAGRNIKMSQGDLNNNGGGGADVLNTPKNSPFKESSVSVSNLAASLEAGTDIDVDEYLDVFGSRTNGRHQEAGHKKEEDVEAVRAKRHVKKRLDMGHHTVTLGAGGTEGGPAAGGSGGSAGGGGGNDGEEDPAEGHTAGGEDSSEDKKDDEEGTPYNADQEQAFLDRWQVGMAVGGSEDWRSKGYKVIGKSLVTLSQHYLLVSWVL